jgi:hypothetical protein
LWLGSKEAGAWVKVRGAELGDGEAERRRYGFWGPLISVEVDGSHALPPDITLATKRTAVASLPGEDQRDCTFREFVKVTGPETLTAALLTGPVRAELGSLASWHPFGLRQGRLRGVYSKKQSELALRHVSRLIDLLPLLSLTREQWPDRLLATVADDRNLYVRRHAASRLMITFPERGFELAALLAADDDPILRVRGLVAIDDQDQLRALVRREPAPLAALALEELGGPADNLPVLLERLDHARPVGDDMLRALRFAPSVAVVDRLAAFVNSRPPHDRDRGVARDVLSSIRTELGLPHGDGALSLVAGDGELALVEESGGLSFEDN